MLFANKKALLEYIESNFSDSEAIVVEIENTKSCTNCNITQPLVETNLTFLSDNPKIVANIIESDHNILYVDNAEYSTNCCGTGELHLLERKLLVNMCDMDGVLKVNLDVAINGKLCHNVPFIVKLKEHNKPIIELSNMYGNA